MPNILFANIKGAFVILENHFGTIGLVGMNEVVKIYCGKYYRKEGWSLLFVS